MKKNIYIIISAILLILPFNVKADADVNSNGYANNEGSTTEIDQGLRITGEDSYGIRITVINESGGMISKRYFDYWPSAFDNSTIKQLSGASYKTDIVNNGGIDSLDLDFESYHGNYSTNNGVNIGGNLRRTNKHKDIEKIVRQAINGKKCSEPAFFKDVGYSICEIIEDDCQALKKTYILIEPLVRMHKTVGGEWYVFSGTEAVNYFPKAYASGDISLNTYKNNFGGSVYRNLVNMYLSNYADDSLTYQLKSDGAKYAYFTSKPTSSNVANESQSRIDLFAGEGRDANGNVWGSSMQLVWLGKFAEKCEEKCVFDPKNPTFDVNCCDDEEYLNDYYSDDSTDKSFQTYCCFDDLYLNVFASEVGFKNAGDFIEACCFEPGSSTNYSKYAGLYQSANNIDLAAICKINDEICGNVMLEPDVELDDCDEDNEQNISYFLDPIFNRNSGQFKDWNIKDIEDYALSHRNELPTDWSSSIAEEYNNNTFLAVAESQDERYKISLGNDYCDMYCQEMFEVLLPDNYPFVDAGRYFTWTIKESESILAKASLGMLCAVDIDLDKAIDDYQRYSSDAQDAASKLANITCDYDWGVKPVLDGAFADCEAYKDYLIDEDTDSTCSIDYVCVSTTSQSCTRTGPNGEQIPGLKYSCSESLSGRDARKWRVMESDSKPAYIVTGVCGHEPIEYTLTPLYKYCTDAKEAYERDVEGYSTRVGNIKRQIVECNSMGKMTVEMDTQFTLNYKTLFSDEFYSTPDQIIKENIGGINAYTSACIDSSDDEECSSDYFKMSKREDEISCNTSGISWTGEDYTADGYIGRESEDIENGYVDVLNPNDQAWNLYDPTNAYMVNSNRFSRKSGFQFDQKYFYSINDNDGTLWDTIYVGFMSNHEIYELAAEVNACVCKDGEVRDSEDGICDCVKKINYSEFIEEYNNYQILPNGTLSVEFMNGPGTYPISLEYSNIGSIDEFGEAHFNTFINESGDCPDGVCVYGDPNGVCRYVIKNRIIANPDDKCPNGDCNDICPDGDCSDICGDNDCGDYDCIDHNGDPLPHCQNVTGLNIIYRIIDVGDPFPGTDGSGRKPGSNWCIDDDCETLVNDVITNANSSVSGSTPLYSFTLTPAIIKDIRTDNNTNMDGDYLKGTLVYPEGPSVGGGYSYFLNSVLPGIIYSHGGTYSINIDGKEWKR